MKAVRLFGARNLRLVDEQKPEPASDEVLLKIKAVGVCGSDMNRYRGGTFEDEDSSYPLILGHEFAAYIEELGGAVHGLKFADRVAVEAGKHCGVCEQCLRGYPNLCSNMKFCGVPPYDGALREYMAWPASLVYPLPNELTYDDGVMVEVLGICLHALDLCKFKPGWSAAVLGCGPIGLTTVQLLSRTAGASQIFATDILPYRLGYAKKMGANKVINAGKEDVTSAVNELTNGRGVDVVFEAAGLADTCRQAVEIWARGGKVLLIGIPPDDVTPFATSPARRKGLTFRFVRRSCLTYPRSIALLREHILDLSSLVTHHFPLQQTSEAFKLVNNYTDGVVKAVITP